MTVLVSACLLGVPCRYDGQSKRHPLAQELCRRHRVIPVCGEIFGGLPTPRPPAEICGQRVVTREGADVTADALISFARERLAHFKCPTRVEYVAELPRNATGKVLARELKSLV